MEHGHNLLKKWKRRPEKAGITVEVFGYTCIEGPEWEYDAVSLVSVHGGISFPLCEGENLLIRAALEEIKPTKDHRWHHIRLNRIRDYSGYPNEPGDDYFEFVSIRLIPIQCEKCGTNIKESEAQKMLDAGVNQYCSLYCANVAGGVPIPGSTGDYVFLKYNVNQ